MIDFNIAPHTGNEVKYIQEAIASGKICGDGTFTKKCSQWMKEHFYTNQAFLTTSCTHALEMAAVLSGVKPGMKSSFPPTPLFPQQMLLFKEVHPLSLSIFVLIP